MEGDEDEKYNLFVLTSFVLCSTLSAKAQLQPSMIDMTPSINATINNSINSARTRILMNRSANSRESTAVSQRKAIGAARIRAGKASLVFKPTEAGTLLYIKGLTFLPEGPQTLPEQVATVNNYVKRFNVLMTKAGYQLYNTADSLALSSALAHEAYYDKKPSSSQVEEIRQNYRQQCLSQAYCQGAPESEMQWYYMQYAFMSLQAIDQRIKARSAQKKSEQMQADERAKEYAKVLLKFD